MGDDRLHGSSPRCVPLLAWRGTQRGRSCCWPRPRYAAKKIFLVEIPNVVDVVDDEGAVVEEPVLVGVLKLVVGVLDEVGPLVEDSSNFLFLLSSKSTSAMAGPAKAAIAAVTAATATTERIRLIFTTSCVFGDPQWIAPSPETSLRGALWVWGNPPREVWAFVLLVPRFVLLCYAQAIVGSKRV